MVPRAVSTTKEEAPSKSTAESNKRVDKDAVQSPTAPSTPKVSDQSGNDETGDDASQPPAEPLSPVVAWGDSIVEQLGQHFVTDEDVVGIIKGSKNPINLNNKSIWKALDSFNFAGQPHLIGREYKIPPHVLVADDWKTSLTNAFVYAFGGEDMQQRERVKFRAASKPEKSRLNRQITMLHKQRNRLLLESLHPLARPTGIVYPKPVPPPEDQEKANREMEGVEVERSKNNLERLRQLVGYTESQAVKSNDKKRERIDVKKEDDSPKKKWKRRHLGEPPSSIGEQSDSSARKAEESALINCSKAITTMHYPGQGLEDGSDDKTKRTEDTEDDDEHPMHGFSVWDDHGTSQDTNDKVKKKGNHSGTRSLGVPPPSIGAQSDSGSRKAEMSAIDHCASAIMTMHFPSSDPETPINTMMLVILDEVLEQIGLGGRLRHGPAPIPRLAMLAFDEATARRILEKLNEQFLFRDDETDPPSPCIKEQLFTGNDLSLIDTVVRHIERKKAKQARVKQAKQAASRDAGVGEENLDLVNQETSYDANQHEERDMTYCGPDTPVHSMLLVVLNEVLEQDGSGGRLKHGRAPTPRLTVMAYDPGTAGRILLKLNEQLLHRGGVPPPCIKEEIYGTDELSLMDAVARHKEQVEARRAKLRKVTKDAPTYKHTFGM